MPLELVEEIARTAPKAVVVADEAYVEFADEHRQKTARCLMDRVENLLVSRTFSKAYGIPNLRVGYVLGPEDAVEVLFKIKPKWNVGEVAQQAAVGALSDQEHFRKVLEVVREGRRFLSDRLSRIRGLEVVPEPQGNFIMVKVKGTGHSAEAFTEAVGAQGIIIRGDFHPEYVRISIGTASDNEAVVKAIEKVK
jgi:histidinol-phosphate aminotransferase